MKNKKNGIHALPRICFLVAGLSLMCMANAQAYLDPAATSYIIQIISGIIIACGVTIGIFWKKIRLFFRNIKTKAQVKQAAKKIERKDEHS